MIGLIRCASPIEQSMRFECLTRRPFAQEGYLESLVKDAVLFKIQFSGTPCGYVLLQNECIVEFFIYPDCSLNTGQIMVAVESFTHAESALCQSFDHQLTSACLSVNWRPKPIAHLFRKCDTSIISANLRPRLAQDTEIESILKIHDGFFDDEDEIVSYCGGTSRLFVYQHENIDVACGVIKQTVDCRQDFDIGMVVAPTHRGNGYGAAVANHLKNYCVEQGWNPVAGCSVDNIASKLSLERAGFVSEHDLNKFSSQISKD